MDEQCTQPPARPGWFSTELFPYESRHIDIFDHCLHYVDEGSGPVLLMLHGGLGWSFVFAKLIPLLKESFRCIAVDMPGYGLSVSRGKDYSHNMANYALVAEELISQLDLRGVTLLGLNVSGPMCAVTAAACRERVDGLVLGGSYLWPLAENPLALQGQTLLHVAVLPLLSRSERMLHNWLCDRLSCTLSQDELEMFTAPLREKEGRQACASLIKSVLDSRYFLGEVKHALDQLRDMPLLYIVGGNDPIHHPQTLQRLEGLFDSVTHCVAEGSNTATVMHQPEFCAQSIKQWHAGLITADGA